MILLVRALVAFAVGASGTVVAARAARRLKLLDHPGPRKPHSAPVPLAGGVGVAAGVAAGVAGAGIASEVLLGALALVLVGLLDDARDVRARTRLLGQAAIVLPAALAYAPSLGLGRPIEVALALLWILAVISATNCIDCADAVAASTAVAAAVMLGSLADWAAPVGALAAAIAGAAGGFLLLNAPPARAFLGEAGSTLLGFLLAVLALGVSKAAPPDRSLTTGIAALAVIAVPLLDFVLVHVRRMRSGVRRLSDLMASAGTDHLPHRLQAAGLGPWTVAGACAGGTTLFGLAVLLVQRAGTTGAILTGVGLGASLVGSEAAIVRASRPRRSARVRTARKAHRDTAA